MRVLGNPYVIAGVTLILTALLCVLTGYNLVIGALGGLLLAVGFIILSGSFGARLRNFFPWIGMALLALSALVGVFIIHDVTSGLPKAGVYVGSERLAIVQSPEFERVLNKAGLSLGEVRTAGSLRQIDEATTTDLKKFPIFWSGDSAQAQALVTELKKRGDDVDSVDTFYDPLEMVIFRSQIEILERKFPDKVKKTGGEYTIDTRWLSEFMGSDKTWNDLGLTDYSSPVTVVSSNPLSSGGGQLTLALFAHFWAEKEGGLKVPLSPGVIDRAQYFIKRGGFKQNSSGEVLSEWLLRNYAPWAITYQSEIKSKEAEWKNSAVRVKLVPTVTSSNVMAGVGEHGVPLIQALKNRDSEAFKTLVVAGSKYGYSANPVVGTSIAPPSFDVLSELRKVGQ